MKSFKKIHETGLSLYLATLLCAFAGAAQASTIQDSYGQFAVNFLTGNTVTGALPGFNPALGTLSSIGFTYSAGAVLLQGTAMSVKIQIDDSSGTLLKSITFPNMTGRAKQIESGSFTVPVADFAEFESTGKVDLTLIPGTACRGTADTPSRCSGFSGTVGGDVTYTYTPANPAGPSTPSSVPEPGTFGLWGAGLIGMGLVRRRKRG